MTCRICCHQTRNAMMALVYYARQVEKINPGIETERLKVALARFDRAIDKCAGDDDGD
jgi:hypothetical protein